jgi:hypothetical protein
MPISAAPLSTDLLARSAFLDSNGGGSSSGETRMTISPARSFGWAVLVLTAMAFAPARAGDVSLVATDIDRVAIGGYDTVAYFTDGKAIKGDDAYVYRWDEATWKFASAAHRALFIADPNRYMPQFGGFCAGAMTKGVLVPANPKTWTIVDGKLYMTSGTDISGWQADAANEIKQADEQWRLLQDQGTTP